MITTTTRHTENFWRRGERCNKFDQLSIDYSMRPCWKKRRKKYIWCVLIGMFWLFFLFFSSFFSCALSAFLCLYSMAIESNYSFVKFTVIAIYIRITDVFRFVCLSCCYSEWESLLAGLTKLMRIRARDDRYGMRNLLVKHSLAHKHTSHIDNDKATAHGRFGRSPLKHSKLFFVLWIAFPASPHAIQRAWFVFSRSGFFFSYIVLCAITIL